MSNSQLPPLIDRLLAPASGSALTHVPPLDGRSAKSAILAGGVVVMALDCSGSMAGEKIRHAKRGLEQFAAEAILGGYTVAVVAFASSARVVTEPTASPRTLNVRLEALAADGGTDMAGALRCARDILINVIGRERVICVVTDGAPNDRNATLEEARRCREAFFIDIMAIGTDDADSSFLAELASRTSLSAKVDASKLEEKLASMAKLLPRR